MASVSIVILLMVMGLSGFMFCKDTFLMFWKPSVERVKDICFSGVVFVMCVVTISWLVVLNHNGGV